jgi:hypothetical protein
MVFQSTDAFTFGIGCDLAGAYLLARGLLASDRQMAMAGATTWNWNAVDILGRARDRVDAQAGILALLLGFVTQAAGYTLGLSGVSTASGAVQVAVGVLLSIVAGMLVLGGWAMSREGALKRRLVAVASIDGGTGETLARPDANMLFSLGMAAGWSGLMVNDTPETRAVYCERVFGVPAVPLPQKPATFDDLKNLTSRRVN